MCAHDVRIAIANPSQGSARCIRMRAEQIFDPWEVAYRLGIRVIRGKLHRARGYNDGSHKIWVDSRLSTCEARVTLTHEIAHVIHGHVGRQPPHVEDMVRKVTARWLIPWGALLDEMGEQIPIEWVAEALCVTPDVVLDRLTYATEAELAMLREASCAELSA